MRADKMELAAKFHTKVAIDVRKRVAIRNFFRRYSGVYFVQNLFPVFRQVEIDSMVLRPFSCLVQHSSVSKGRKAYYYLPAPLTGNNTTLTDPMGTVNNLIGDR